MERTCTVLEHLAANSYRYVTDEYYEVVIQARTVRDNDSVEMLDIIFETVRYDCGMIFNFGGVVDNIFNQYNGLNESTVKSNATIWGISLENEIKNIMAALNR